MIPPRAQTRTVNHRIWRKSGLGRRDGSVAIVCLDLISGGQECFHGYTTWKAKVLYCQWHSVAGRGCATWISKPCISYREDKIKAHMRSFSHKEASKLQAEAEESARTGGIRQAFETSVTIERKAFIAALKVMHWLAKEEIAHTTKFESLISLANIGAKELKALSKGANASERTMHEFCLQRWRNKYCKI